MKVSADLFAAAMRDFSRAVEQARQSFLAFGQAFLLAQPSWLDQERRAYADFCLHGGDPDSIYEIEEMFDVDSTAFGETT